MAVPLTKKMFFAHPQCKSTASGRRKRFLHPKLTAIIFCGSSFGKENVFRSLAVQKHSFGTKKTLSASEINRYYFLWQFLWQRKRFSPTRIAKAQLRDEENASISIIYHKNPITLLKRSDFFAVKKLPLRGKYYQFVNSFKYLLKFAEKGAILN